MESNMKLVDFEKYCPTCKHINISDEEDPCNECLTCPAREFSHKPIKWEDRKKK